MQVLNYRLYFFGQGHITHYVHIQSASDEEAIEAAEKQGAGAVTELWRGARLVRRFEGAPTPRTSTPVK